MEQLPDEILISIADALDTVEDIVKIFALINRRFSELARDDMLWKKRLLTNPNSKNNCLLSPPPSYYKRFKSEFVKVKGNAFYEDELFAESAQCYLKALEHDPTNYILHSNLSSSYCQLNRYAEALREADLTIEKLPHWGKSYHRKAFAYLQLFEYQEAYIIACYAIRVVPKYEPIREVKIVAKNGIRFQRQRPDSVRMLRKVVRIFTQHDVVSMFEESHELQVKVFGKSFIRPIKEKERETADVDLSHALYDFADTNRPGPNPNINSNPDVNMESDNEDEQDEERDAIPRNLDEFQDFHPQVQGDISQSEEEDAWDPMELSDWELYDEYLHFLDVLRKIQRHTSKAIRYIDNMRLLSLLRCFPDAKSDEIPPEVDLSLHANFDGLDINAPDPEPRDDDDGDGQPRMLF